MTVSVFGVAKRIPTPVFPTSGTAGFPTEVSGISADFVQGLVTVQLEIRGVQQTACPASGTCAPATTLTIVIPYELNPDSGTPAQLHVREAGSTVATVNLKPVSDSVHIINTCDQTGIFLSLADGIPDGTCAPMIMHPRGPLVSPSAPATPGETLVVWAYGLGAVDHPITPGCCAAPEQLPLAVQPFTVNLSFADLGSFPMRRLAQLVPTYVGSDGGGIYQVQFVVPAVQNGPGIPAGRPALLNIQVSGPASADSAQVYIQP
jgi:uncharacterized protein (TIGR03437 family)